MSGLTLSETAVADLRGLLDGGVPLIAVSFSDRMSDADLRDAQAKGLDVAELRIDRYSSSSAAEVIAEVKRFAAFPTIATIRAGGERGDWTGTEDERLRLFEAVLPEVQALDIELNSSEILPRVVAAARAQGKVVIISNHNFDRTPSSSELEEMASRAKELGADYVKLSAMARSEEDVRTLASFTLKNAELGLIVIAMGGHGTTSRVFFPALGSRLTYAHGGAHAVPGQLDFEDTFEMLRRFYPAFNEKKIIDLQIMEGS